MNFFPITILFKGNEQLVRKASELPQGEDFRITATHVGQQHEHRSTATDEYYFHVNNEATAFFRLEPDGFKAAVALCNPLDQFSRSKGRNIARRKYFRDGAITGLKSITTDKPTYEDALKAVEAERIYVGLAEEG